MIYAIGDIHGCLPQLEELLGRILPTAEKIVFLGDYVDRGPSSYGVIETLSSLHTKTNAELIFIRGNHDQVMLDVLEQKADLNLWSKMQGDSTIDEYTNDGYVQVPRHHYEFLKKTEIYHDDGTHLFVHAGISPYLEMDEQSPEEMMWIRKIFLCSNHIVDRIVVHGHTPVRTPRNVMRKIGVDTGCYATGILTALQITPDLQYNFVQTNPRSAPEPEEKLEEVFRHLKN